MSIMPAAPRSEDIFLGSPLLAHKKVLLTSQRVLVHCFTGMQNVPTCKKIYFLSSLTYKNCHGHSVFLVCTQSATLKNVPSSYWQTKRTKNIISKYLHLNHAKKNPKKKIPVIAIATVLSDKTSSFFIVIAKISVSPFCIQTVLHKVSSSFWCSKPKYIIKKILILFKLIVSFLI